MNCDNCKHYHWYYDYCDKWDCEIDARACNSCFEERNANKRGINMLALTKKQLLLVLEKHYDRDDKLIKMDNIKKLYEAYGDEYFCDYGYGAPWELTNENEAWKNMRGQEGIPKKEDKII